MKTKKALLFTMFFALVTCGCNNKEETIDDDDTCGYGNREETIDVALEYAICPCEDETEYYGHVFRENVLLFDAAKTSPEQMISLSFDSANNSYEYIGFDNNERRATHVIVHGHMGNFGRICNFPEIVDCIPSTGLRVSFSYDAFSRCKPPIIIMEDSYADIVLTSLKLHIK